MEGAVPRAPKSILQFPIPPTWVGQPGATTFDPQVSQYVMSNVHSIHEDGGVSDKVVVVGDMGVGKTSLVLRNCRDSFSANYKATIGVDFMSAGYMIQGVEHTLHIWDTAGQERFRALSNAYYRGAGVVLVCFDLTDPRSLDHAKTWMSQVWAENDKSVLVFLVGLKLDLEENVSPVLGESIARDMGAEYYECSAKDNEGVQELFERVAVLSFERKIRALAGADSTITESASSSGGSVAIGSTVRSGKGKGSGQPIKLGQPDNGSNSSKGGRKKCCGT